MVLSTIYSNVKSLLFEKGSSTTYDDYLIPNANRIIMELYEENNMKRMFNGEAPLTSIPTVTTTADDVPFEDEYIYIMELGLCALFMIDDDLQKYSIYNTDYNNARVKAQCIVDQDTIDELSA